MESINSTLQSRYETVIDVKNTQIYEKYNKQKEKGVGSKLIIDTLVKVYTTPIANSNVQNEIEAQIR